MTKFTIRYVVLDKKEIHTLNFFSLGYICCFSSSIPIIFFSAWVYLLFFLIHTHNFFLSWVYLLFFLIHTQNFFLAWVYLLFFLIHTQNFFSLVYICCFSSSIPKIIQSRLLSPMPSQIVQRAYTFS